MIINWWMKIDKKHLENYRQSLLKNLLLQKMLRGCLVIESILRPHGGSAPWSEVRISASTHLLIVQFQGR